MAAFSVIVFGVVVWTIAASGEKQFRFRLKTRGIFRRLSPFSLAAFTLAPDLSCRSRSQKNPTVLRSTIFAVDNLKIERDSKCRLFG